MESKYFVYNYLFIRNSLAITTTRTGYKRNLSNLAKIYIDNAKYSGRNDNFTFKLAVFYDICLRANITSKVKMKVFLTMLKGLALNYYYSNISTNTVVTNFDQV